MLARILPAVLLFAIACASGDAAPNRADVASVLDRFHQAASSADEETYFGLIAPDGVFIGTDATERWTKEAFRAYARPHFSEGRGWTFVPRNRNLAFSADGRTAWFDEMLDSASYGECRGTGVVQLHDGRWRIEQYHLTIPIPNEIANEIVGKIRGRE
jgi:hypothetical protein